MRFFFISAATAIALCACSPIEVPPPSTEHVEAMQNPLYAERYSEDMVSTLANLIITDDPSAQGSRKRALIDEQREYWLAKGTEAREAQSVGAEGQFTPVSEPVRGEVLLTKERMYFGSTFDTAPGPDLRVYLTTAVDPRELSFPDRSSRDIGPLLYAYGTQDYPLQPLTDEELLQFRTVVLWDASLDRLYGFAQLSPNR